MINERFSIKTNPIANPLNQVYFSDYRVTVLSDRLFRIEKSPNKKFRDDATQSVWFRNTEKVDFSVEISKNRAVIKTARVTLLLSEKREDCRIKTNGKTLKIDNSGNLFGTSRTLDRCDGDDVSEDYSAYGKFTGKVELDYGVCSENGVAVFDDAKSLSLSSDGEILNVTGDGTDEYVFAYGKDYLGAVKALFLITGKPPLLPRYALGNWWSRYYLYTDRTYLTLLEKFAEKKVPLTVATIDMDWHYSTNVDKEVGITEKGRNEPYYGGNNGWTGYGWNKNLFPNPKEFLKKIKERGLKITLNLHPADGIRWWDDNYEDMARAMGVDPESAKQIPFNITNPDFLYNYFDKILRPMEKDGVDFWWIDWQQGTTSELDGLDPLWALNHYHFIDNSFRKDRPLILSRYAGIGSHRYPVGFSGDTYTTFKTLSYLPYFTATASNVGYTWWSHDIGGHMFGVTDDELYLRSVQFGTFSPINRLHCSDMTTVTKEPWCFENGKGEIAEEFLRFRHKLIPYLYTRNYLTATDGQPLVTPLYYRYPNDKKAYEFKNEYYFGDLIVAPVCTKLNKDGFARVKAWLPQGRYTDIFTGDEYDVKSEKGEVKTLYRRLESIPVLAPSGTVLPLSLDDGNSCENPVRIELNVFNGNGKFSLYETKEDKEFFTDVTTEEENGAQKVTISGRGDKTVIPSQRKIKVVFRNVSDGEIYLYKNGKGGKAEPDYCDKSALTFDYDPNCEYAIEVKFSEDGLSRIKKHATEILCRAEGDNFKKQNLAGEIAKAKSLCEYASAVDNGEVADVTKKRLKEVL